MNRHLSRREFIKWQAKSGLLLAAAAGGMFRPRLSLAVPAAHIGVATGGAAAATRAAVDLIGGIRSIVQPGQRVLIKPNMSFSRAPEYAANTHPEVVKTVAAMCQEAGAAKITILDHTLGPAKRCIERSGIGAVCATIAKNMVHPINEPSFYAPVTISKAKHLKTTDVAREFLKADVLIAVPVAKSHSATGVSLSMKGMMGLIYDRSIMHRMGLHESIVDLTTFLKADLTVIDGTRVLITGGPGGSGKVITKNTVIASRDMVAADAFAVAKFEWYGRHYQPTQVRHIRLAHERGLGCAALDDLSIQTTRL